MDTLFIYFFGKKQNHENCGKNQCWKIHRLLLCLHLEKKKRYTGWWWGEEKDT